MCRNENKTPVFLHQHCLVFIWFLEHVRSLYFLLSAVSSAWKRNSVIIKSGPYMHMSCCANDSNKPNVFESVSKSQHVHNLFRQIRPSKLRPLKDRNDSYVSCLALKSSKMWVIAGKRESEFERGVCSLPRRTAKQEIIQSWLVV